MPGAAKLGAGTQPKKLGGGLKKLAPPPGFKGKAKTSAQGNLLGGGANTLSTTSANPVDLLGLDSG